MHNLQFYVSGKKAMDSPAAHYDTVGTKLWVLTGPGVTHSDMGQLDTTFLLCSLYNSRLS